MIRGRTLKGNDWLDGGMEESHEGHLPKSRHLKAFVKKMGVTTVTNTKKKVGDIQKNLFEKAGFGERLTAGGCGCAAGCCWSSNVCLLMTIVVVLCSTFGFGDLGTVRSVGLPGLKTKLSAARTTSKT